MTVPKQCHIKYLPLPVLKLFFIKYYMPHLPIQDQTGQVCKVEHVVNTNKSSAVAEKGDRGHNRQGRKEGGSAVALSRTAGITSNTMWPVLRSTSVPSGVFIHPAIWPQ